MGKKIDKGSHVRRAGEKEQRKDQAVEMRRDAERSRRPGQPRPKSKKKQRVGRR